MKTKTFKQLQETTVAVKKARDVLENSTGAILSCVERNEFVAGPATPFEEKLWRARERVINSELVRARKAMRTLERFCRGS